MNQSIAKLVRREASGGIVLDLSFDVREKKNKGSRTMGPVIQQAVNKSTSITVPQEPVRELGTVLPKLFNLMRSTPAKQVIHFSKLDLSDGFWRLITNAQDAYNFCYVLPALPGQPLQIVVPSALQMGWQQSPAAFCAATETTRDIVQGYVDQKIVLPPHPMEKFMIPARPARKQEPGSTAPQATYVYVDDFVLAAVEDNQGSQLSTIARAALHGIHSIFPPPAITGHVNGKDPISQKKLDKGDAKWDPNKVILGFQFNGKNRTVCLPPDKAERLNVLLTQVLRKTKIRFAKFQSLNGQLRHAASIFPAAKALFTPMNKSLSKPTAFVGLGKGSELRKTLLDFKTIIKNLAARPTHVAELVRSEPDLVEFLDSSGEGSGGVVLGHARPIPPSVWFVQFPLDIQARLVSSENPNGDLTNSDFEMAGVVFGQMALEQLTPMRHTQSLLFSDNTPSVSWSTKMASKATSLVSYNLLRGLAMRQRATQSAPPFVASIPGRLNGLADTASRIEKTLHPHKSPLTFTPVSMPELLTLFNSRYPLSQGKCWQGVTIPPEQVSLVISTLRGIRLPLQRWMVQPDNDHGLTGPPFVFRCASTLGSEPFPHYSNSLTSWLLANESDADTFAPTGASNTNPLKRLYGTFAKRTCWLDSQTLGALQAPTI